MNDDELTDEQRALRNVAEWATGGVMDPIRRHDVQTVLAYILKLEADRASSASAPLRETTDGQ